jgi:hypothetical protein
LALLDGLPEALREGLPLPQDKQTRKQIAEWHSRCMWTELKIRHDETTPYARPHNIIQAIAPTAKYFACLDAAGGYCQIDLAERSRDMTCFLLPSGRWRYSRGPMGRNATSDKGCRRSYFIIQGNKGAMKIIDHVIIYAETLEELEENVAQVLQKCEDINITLYWKKFKMSISAIT